MKQLSLKEFFEVEHKAGQTQDSQDYKNLHYYLGKQIIERFQVNTLTEIGPGPGALIEYFIRGTNVDAIGIDINPYSREYFLSRNPGYDPHYILADISEYDFPGGDMLVSIETFEHIENHVLFDALSILAQRYKWFWFSSTPKKTTPEQDIAWGHINVKYDYEWVMMMERYGWQFHSWAKTPTEWAMIFESRICQI